MQSTLVSIAGASNDSLDESAQIICVVSPELLLLPFKTLVHLEDGFYCMYEQGKLRRVCAFATPIQNISIFRRHRHAIDGEHLL